jgi:uridine phosphorylase
MTNKEGVAAAEMELARLMDIIARMVKPGMAVALVVFNPADPTDESAFVCNTYNAEPISNVTKAVEGILARSKAGTALDYDIKAPPPMNPGN